MWLVNSICMAWIKLRLILKCSTLLNACYNFHTWLSDQCSQCYTPMTVSKSHQLLFRWLQAGITTFSMEFLKHIACASCQQYIRRRKVNIARQNAKTKGVPASGLPPKFAEPNLGSNRACPFCQQRMSYFRLRGRKRLSDERRRKAQAS